MADLKSKYMVQRPILHNKKLLCTGTLIDMTDDEAGHLRLTGALIAVEAVVALEPEPQS